MDAQRANEIEVLLEGVPLPASRDMLVAYAATQDGDVAEVLRRQLPERDYDRLDLVGEQLRGAVTAPDAPPALPIAESGKPPGGDEYVRAFPQPGAVPKSEPPAVLKQQSKTQKQQQAKQER